MPLVGAAGIVVVIAVDVDPVHDNGLFVFEGAWVVLAIAIAGRKMRGVRRGGGLGAGRDGLYTPLL